MIVYVLLMQMLEPNPGPLHAHEFETHDFEAMYPNIPDAALQDIMRKLLNYAFKYQSQRGLFSIEIRWGFAHNHTNPVAREPGWPLNSPQFFTADSSNHLWVGPVKIFQVEICSR